MKAKFYAPDLTDKRIIYASRYLENLGYECVDFAKNANFVLLGVNPDKRYLNYDIPVFAGNIKADNIFDYTKDEAFALKNAYLTAESALSLAITESKKSIINSTVLIVGYGRIGKALHKYLSAFTNDITICARDKNARILAEMSNASAVDFNSLKEKNTYKFIFNTVPHPVFNEQELSAVNKDALIIDLASFPGGIDKHIAKSNGLNLITARGLPAKYSPETAGEIVGETVNEMIKSNLIKGVII